MTGRGRVGDASDGASPRATVSISAEMVRFNVAYSFLFAIRFSSTVQCRHELFLGVK